MYYVIQGFKWARDNNFCIFLETVTDEFKEGTGFFKVASCKFWMDVVD